MILITGASGLLGATLLAVAADRGRAVAGVCHRQAIRVPGVAIYRADLAEPETVRDLVRTVQPQWVVHCAAVTDVDWCERNPESTWQVNVGMAGAVAREAAEIGAGVVHISTDSVFD